MDGISYLLVGHILEIEEKTVKEWGRKRKDCLDLLLCTGWSWRMPGPSQGTRRAVQQASNPCDGGRGGAESGSGLPTLGNSVYGKHCFPYRWHKRGTTVRPRDESHSWSDCWRLKDTFILVEWRRIALVSVSSRCWLCLRDVAQTRGIMSLWRL